MFLLHLWQNSVFLCLYMSIVQFLLDNDILHLVDLVLVHQNQ